MPKPAIRKGNPFAPSKVEDLIIKGMRGNRFEEKRQFGKFLGSQAAHCPRRAVKHFFTERRGSISPSSTGYMAIGNTIHEMITDALYKQGSLIFKEYKLPSLTSENSSWPNLRGVIDAIFFTHDDRIAAAEIKSCGNNLPAKPKRNAVLQAETYASVTGFPFYIVYFSRNVAHYTGELKLKAFELESSNEDLKRTLTKVCLAHLCAQDRVLPQIPLGYDAEGECRYCPFKSECWGSDSDKLETLSDAEVDIYYDLAYQMAEEIFMTRDNRRNGILHRISRDAVTEPQRKLADVSWD